MKKYMLILFSYGGLEQINKHIKNKLKPEDKLFVRAVKLEKVPKLSEHLISEVGVLGRKVVNDLEESVVDNYYDNAKNYMKEIKRIAVKNGFELDEKLIDHNNLEKLKDEIKQSDFDEIVINFSQNEFASDQLEEENVKSWLKKLKLSQDIFYDGRKRK